MEMPQELVATLVDATRDVFATMVFKDVTAADPPHPVSGTAWPHAGPRVVATVSFTGYRCGCVSIYSTLEAANAIAGGMLGIEPASVNGQMADAIGEIANMVAGTLRTRMTATEPAWHIGIPTVTIGSDFSTTYVASTIGRVVCPFELEGRPMAVELILHKS